ncbi:MAG TPA: phosphoglycerate dehydrogenase, partial [Solirubrobacteraceae bacterium]|nr:phosphoglycerate dehydrogenase [Solirubrobacteraceae bacterium]
MTGRPRVLVRENVGDPGVDLLREHFDVDLGFDWTLEELTDRIGAYDGILIRSATKLTADLIARGTAL